MESEFGSFSPISFPNMSHAMMYDKKGSVLMCKCGNYASGGAFGKESFITWCIQCSPMEKIEPAKLIYRPQKVDDGISED